MKPDRPARMIKYGIGYALACLYVAASAWVVDAEGRSYRRGLRPDSASEARPEPSATEPDAPATPGSEMPTLVARAAPDLSGIVPALDPSQAPTIEERKPADPPGPAVPAPAQAQPADPFWAEPEQTKVWDLDRLTTEDERQLGAALHQAIRRFHPPLEVGPLPRRVEDATEPYLKNCSRKDVTYTFTVLDCDNSNVFSHPGGYIYVCQGLFDWIAEDEDYALEFLLAHEIAHVDLAHAIICLRDPAVKQLKSGTVPLFYSLAIPWGYLESQDFESDKWAWDQMRKAGRSRYESLSFFRKLEDYARKNGFENVRKKPTEEPGVPLLDNHIRAHPVIRKRLKALMTLKDPAQNP